VRVHGTDLMYLGGCRCRECKKARAKALRGRRQQRCCTPDPSVHMVAAFAERFKTTAKLVRRIGTLQLCMCRSDEARRILLKACAEAIVVAKKGNAVMNENRRAA